MPDLRKSRKKEVQDIGYALKEKYLENIGEVQLHLLAQRLHGGVLTCDVADWRAHCCLMGVNQGTERAEVSSCKKPHMDVGEGQVERLVREEAVNQWEECFVSQRGRCVPELGTPDRRYCWEDSPTLEEKNQKQAILKTDQRLTSEEGGHRVAHHSAEDPEN
jgi:hypothetical protein